MTDTAQSIDRHDTGPPESWRPSLENSRLLRRVILERTPRASDGAELLACERDRAALLSVLGAPSADIAQAVALGAGAGAAGAMAHAARDGAVLLREPDSPGPRTIPAGDAGMTPLLWRDALMLALAARDAGALAVLVDPARIAACQLGPERADTFWPRCCRALAAVAAGAADTAAQADAALAEMDDVRIADPATIAALDRPLIVLARQLARGGIDWDAAVADALARHHAHFGTEARRYDRAGFLAFGVIGLCALAHDRGIDTAVRSPYLPRFLVDGSVRAPLSAVVRLAGSSRAVADEAADMALTLAAAEALKLIVTPVLETLRGPNPARAAAALRPRPDDYAAVFVGAAVEIARREYERFWQHPPPFPAPDPLRTELQVHLAPAGMLDQDNLLTRHFPAGYRAIARWLNPHRIWAAWSFVQPGGTGGLSYDGLVWCDDHWVWFPRPYQLVGPALL